MSRWSLVACAVAILQRAIVVARLAQGGAQKLAVIESRISGALVAGSGAGEGSGCQEALFECCAKGPKRACAPKVGIADAGLGAFAFFFWRHGGACPRFTWDGPSDGAAWRPQSEAGGANCDAAAEVLWDSAAEGLSFKQGCGEGFTCCAASQVVQERSCVRRADLWRDAPGRDLCQAFFLGAPNAMQGLGTWTSQVKYAAECSNATRYVRSPLGDRFIREDQLPAQRELMRLSLGSHNISSLFRGVSARAKALLNPQSMLADVDSSWVLVDSIVSAKKKGLRMSGKVHKYDMSDWLVIDEAYVWDKLGKPTLQLIQVGGEMLATVWETFAERALDSNEVLDLQWVWRMACLRLGRLDVDRSYFQWIADGGDTGIAKAAQDVVQQAAAAASAAQEAAGALFHILGEKPPPATVSPLERGDLQNLQDIIKDVPRSRHVRPGVSVKAGDLMAVLLAHMGSENDGYTQGMADLASMLLHHFGSQRASEAGARFHNFVMRFGTVWAPTSARPEHWFGLVKQVAADLPARLEKRAPDLAHAITSASIDQGDSQLYLQLATSAITQGVFRTVLPVEEWWQSFARLELQGAPGVLQLFEEILVKHREQLASQGDFTAQWALLRESLRG